jgi:anti-sigma factor RsiW
MSEEPMMKPDHDTFREWLYLHAGDVEDSLSPERRERLQSHLAECPECQAEERELQHLKTVLTRGALPVRADFRQSVLESLPAAGWEGRHPQTWRFPGSVALLLGILAAALFGVGSGRTTGSPVFGAVSALGGFFRATLLAGLGVVQASSKGWGMVFSELFDSWSTLAAFAVLVVCLNLLLLSLVRRRQDRGVLLSRGGSPRG